MSNPPAPFPENRRGCAPDTGVATLAVAAVLLLVAGVAAGLAEIPRWYVCVGASGSPACIAAEGIALSSSVLPGPYWKGDPIAAVVQGVGLLCIGGALHLLLAGRVGRVWHGLLVYPTAGCGLLTAAAGLAGQGNRVNDAALVVWGGILPLLYLLALMPLSAANAHLVRPWATALLLVLSFTSLLPQVVVAIAVSGYHDAPSWYGLYQAVPLLALGMATLLGATMCPCPWPWSFGCVRDAERLANP